MLLLHLVLFVPVSKVEITLRLALNEANVKRQTQGTSYFLLNYWRGRGKCVGLPQWIKRIFSVLLPYVLLTSLAWIFIFAGTHSSCKAFTNCIFPIINVYQQNALIVSLRTSLLHITVSYTFRPFLCHHQRKIIRKRKYLYSTIIQRHYKWLFVLCQQSTRLHT
jgi:hypothetical protein